jgi:cellulose synthase/poly-beta-1,6-N-acetylglucosamine synthase-like glycosyltransferase
MRWGWIEFLGVNGYQDEEEIVRVNLNPPLCSHYRVSCIADKAKHCLIWKFQEHDGEFSVLIDADHTPTNLKYP